MFPKTLPREILLVVAAKAALLGLIYVLFFAPAPGMLSVQSHILNDQSR